MLVALAVLIMSLVVTLFRFRCKRDFMGTKSANSEIFLVNFILLCNLKRLSLATKIYVKHE